MTKCTANYIYIYIYTCIYTKNHSCCPNGKKYMCKYWLMNTNQGMYEC